MSHKYDVTTGFHEESLDLNTGPSSKFLSRYNINSEPEFDNSILFTLLSYIRHSLYKLLLVNYKVPIT